MRQKCLPLIVRAVPLLFGTRGKVKHIRLLLISYLIVLLLCIKLIFLKIVYRVLVLLINHSDELFGALLIFEPGA